MFYFFNSGEIAKYLKHKTFTLENVITPILSININKFRRCG